MKVTYREKIALIVVIVILVFVAGGMIFIKPALASITTANQQLTAKEQEKSSIELKINSSEDLKAKIQKAYKESKSLSDFFIDEIDTYQADQLLSPICDQSGIKIKSMKLDAAAPEEVKAYNYAINEIIYNLKDDADINGTVSSVANTSQQPQAAVDPNSIDTLAVTNVTIEVEGTVDNVFKFADKIKALNKSVYIQSITGKGEEEPGKLPTGSIVLKVISLKQLEEPKL